MATSLSAFVAGHRASVFSSVFPVSSADHSTPTPIATPNIGYAASGQPSFETSSPAGAAESNSIEAREVKRNLAWSLATRFLSFEPPPAATEYSDSDVGALGDRAFRPTDVGKALAYLIAGEGKAVRSSEQSLVDWYLDEVRYHYLEHFHAKLAAEWENVTDEDGAWRRLEATFGSLQMLISSYMKPVAEHIISFVDGNGEQPVQNEALSGNATKVGIACRNQVQAIFTQSIPQEQFTNDLSFVLFDCAYRLFGLDSHDNVSKDDASVSPEAMRSRITALLRGLHSVGLAGDKAQRAFAYAMDNLIARFVVSDYVKVDWAERESVTGRLRDWVDQGFRPFVVEVLYWLSGGSDEASSSTASEIKHWQDLAVVRLGRARVLNLFDYVVNWDRSLGAIMDLKEYITIPSARNHLTSAFWQQLSTRLLHNGATTTHILEVYVRVIRAFNELDPKGVLLDRVARPIRRYLREREDTARVIISSLLADSDDPVTLVKGHSGEVSLVVAAEMDNSTGSGDRNRDLDLDWNDMSWTPDPIDASPEFKKTRSEDVISDLLSLYDRDDFISEMKNILGEQLLRKDAVDLDKEIRLLELFKLRLGEDKLQPCEVMLRDILESKRMDSALHGMPSADNEDTDSMEEPPQFHTRILSRIFWPALRDDTFTLPASIVKLQEQYSSGFERIKDMRKLEWLPSLGTVEVELAFEDRSISLEVQPWQASIIDAFQDDDPPTKQQPPRQHRPPVSHSVEALELRLDMDEALLRNGLAFWASKRVLVETAPDIYAVLERLDPSSIEESVGAAQAAQEVEAVSAVKSQDDLLTDQMDLYRQFVTGMLTNQGALPVARILNLLKMVVPGGFPFGADEVRSVLRRMVDEGSLVVSGDVFSVRKEE